MRVLMLTSSYPKFRGDTTAPFIESIATHIAAQGVEVHVVLPEHRELRRAPLEDGVHFHPYRYAPRKKWTTWGYAESLASDVRIKRGMYALAPLAMVSSLRTVFQLTAREAFDVVHAHWVIPNAPPAALAARRRHLPLVVSMHGSDVFVAEKLRAAGAAARWSFQRAAWITACSDELMNRALALGADEAKSSLVPYGADAKAFHVDPARAQRVRAALDVGASDPVILAVGRMVEKKGFEFLLAAMPQVLAVVPNARLVFAGYGDLESALVEQARALGLEPHVRFAGRIPRGQIPAYFAAADVVVVPSVRDAAGNVDGLPNVTLEAMAAGKPVVASNIAGFPDVICDGVSGLLVPEKDPGALAQAIISLACDAELRKRMGAAGQAQVHDALNWDKVARRFVEGYQRIAGRG
jgi:glycosyltransferase involved in cell wall biosynthesis